MTLVNKLKKIIRRTDFADQFRKTIYVTNVLASVMQQTACFGIYPITVNNFAALFNYTLVDRASLYDGPDLKLFILVGWDRTLCLLPGPPGLN